MNQNEHLSDENLDKIFHEAGDSFNYSGKSEWETFAKKLDEIEPVGGFWKKYVFGIGALMLFLSLFFINFSAEKNQTIKNTPSKSLKIKPEISKSISNKNTIKESEKNLSGISKNNGLTSAKVSNSSISGVKDFKIESQKTSSSKALINDKKNNGFDIDLKNLETESVNNNSNKSLEKENKRIALGNNSNFNLNKISKNKDIEPEMVKRNAVKEVKEVSYNNIVNKEDLRNQNKISFDKIENDQSSSLEIPTENSEASTLGEFKLTSINSLILKNISINRPLPDINSLDLPPTIIKSNEIIGFRKGLYLQGGYSPDFSFVKEIDEMPLGSNLALNFFYRMNNRWSISLGAQRSIKKYEAYPEDYFFKWKSVNTPLKSIGAVCKMIDIPLNVRYDISTGSRKRWFVGTGLTSYYMMNETYNYYYENNYDPSIKWKKWSGKTGFYGLGVLNVNGGFEYHITKKISLKAEPFLKVPLKQLGFGKVKLSSFGTLVSVSVPFN